MKKQRNYESPKITVVCLDEEEVVRTSKNVEWGWGEQEDWGE